MEKVVDFTSRLQDRKLRRRKEIHKHRSETVQSAVQCASCQFRCAMCGHHMRETESYALTISAHLECNLCKVCQAEYEDFLKIFKGKKKADVFWHNEEWRKLWIAWLDYQKAMGEFKNSDEFTRLAEELEN